ncbi:hypothetical protein LTR17_016907 [Elasticomyces elasticus]|nr:hypothetical protein LTR17_016907 [Elasticomyces elasticus]
MDDTHPTSTTSERIDQNDDGWTEVVHKKKAKVPKSSARNTKDGLEITVDTPEGKQKLVFTYPSMDNAEDRANMREFYKDNPAELASLDEYEKRLQTAEETKGTPLDVSSLQKAVEDVEGSDEAKRTTGGYTGDDPVLRDIAERAGRLGLSLRDLYDHIMMASFEEDLSQEAERLCAEMFAHMVKDAPKEVLAGLERAGEPDHDEMQRKYGKFDQKDGETDQKHGETVKTPTKAPAYSCEPDSDDETPDEDSDDDEGDQHDNTFPTEQRPMSVRKIALLKTSLEIDQAYDGLTNALGKAFQAYDDAAKAYEKVGAGLNRIWASHQVVADDWSATAERRHEAGRTREAEGAHEQAAAVKAKACSFGAKAFDAYEKTRELQKRASRACSETGAAHEAAEKHRAVFAGLRRQWREEHEEEEDEDGDLAM